MRKHNSTEFRATSLTYSSPEVDTTSIAPDFFYNAFPDLNDEAPDGSRSAFPRRAKYLLSLDSMFLPTAIRVNSNSIDEERLASLDARTREVVSALIDKFRPENIVLRIPRTPELNTIHRMQALFEIAHKRLASTDYKWALRSYLLASFYTTLENHLAGGKKIAVPLVDNDSHRASQLQCHWKALNEAFKSTVLVNEAVSLLVCVMLLSPEEGKAYEEAWLREEASEIDGFADYYRKLRDEFNPESCTSEADRRVLAEQILEYAKRSLSSRTMGTISLDEERYFLDLDPKSVRIFWNSLLRKSVNPSLLQLSLREDLGFGQIFGKEAARIGIPQAIQWLLAFYSTSNDERLSFTRKADAWPEFVGFYLETGDDIAYPRVSSAANGHLYSLVQYGIKKADGSRIDSNSNHVSEEAEFICRYTILLESIRQQVCTGVGLRCPFWTGSGCCEFRPLLQRAYDVTWPWNPIWKCHWQQPPCLA